MAKVFVTGDCHGNYHWDKLFAFNMVHPELTKEDMVIVLGDFGVPWHFPLWSSDEVSFHKLKRLKFSLGVVDGNHENFNYLYSLPSENAFGGEVGMIAPDIYWLKRGQIYNINGFKLFTFGGAYSIDKHMRKEGISWWPQEEPSYAECSFGLDSLQLKANNKVDFMLTHEAPLSVLYELYDDDPYHPKMVNPYSLPKYLDILKNSVQFKRWYFGHHHQNKRVNEKFTCLFEAMAELQKED